MKFNLKFIAFLFLIFNCFTITAQTKREMLVGTWTFDYETSVANMEEAAKTILAKVPSAQRRLEKSYKGRQVSFSADGSYLLRLADGNQGTGTWVLNGENEDIITITGFQNHIENLPIMLLSASILIIKPGVDGNNKPMLAKWYFTKI